MQKRVGGGGIEEYSSLGTASFFLCWAAHGEIRPFLAKPVGGRRTEGRRRRPLSSSLQGSGVWKAVVRYWQHILKLRAAESVRLVLCRDCFNCCDCWTAANAVTAATAATAAIAAIAATAATAATVATSGSRATSSSGRTGSSAKSLSSSQNEHPDYGCSIVSPAGREVGLPRNKVGGSIKPSWTRPTNRDFV